MATFIQIYCRHGRSGVLTNQLTTINTILHHIQHNSTQPHTIFNKIHHKQTIYSIQFTIFNISIWNNIPYTTKYLKNSAQKTTSWPRKLKVLDLSVTFPGLPFPFPFPELHNTGIKKSSLPECYEDCCICKRIHIYVVVPVYKLQIFWSCGFLKHKGFYVAQYKIKGGNLAQNFPELEEQKV